MPDSLALLPAGLPATPQLLPALLDLLPNGVVYLTPQLDAAGAVADFAFAYLNPTAQRTLRLPAPPVTTYTQQFPGSRENGSFAFHCAAWLAGGEVCHFEMLYQANGYDGYYQVAARRLAEGLLVSFTDGTEQPRTAVEEALRVSQAGERAALAAAETQRGELQRIFEQAPVAIAVYRGPTYIIELANPLVCALWGRTQTQALHTPLLELLPEIKGQGYEELLDEVMATGVPYVAREMPSTIDRYGRRDTVYWNFVYLPVRAADGRITGAMVVATEVSEQVQARQQVQALNEELEARVTQRTAELQVALQEAEKQREQLRTQQALLGQILGQVPAAIATLTGPEHRYSFFNAPYQALAAGRTALGLKVVEVFPEVEEQGFVDLLNRVYATGQPYSGTGTPIMLHDNDTGQPETRYMDFIYQPLFNAKGQTTGILAFVLDVTDSARARKQADTLQAAVLAAVRRQGQERENVHQLFAQAPAVICLLREPSHRIEYLNPAYQALFPGRQLLGHTLAEVQPEALALLALLDEVHGSGEAQFRREMPVVVPPTEAGQPWGTYYFDFTYQAYREEGRIAGVSIFGFDVTEQVEARQQVQNLNEELAAINEEMQATNEELHESNTRLLRTNTDLDTFVYTASHDLKSPITNVEGLLLALRDHLPANALDHAVVPRLLDMMAGAVSRFQQTLGHLTDISRLQQEQSQPAEAVDLPALVEAVRLDILPELTAADATLAIDLDGCHTVHFSAKNLRSIVYNLLSNAVKYRAEGRPAHCCCAATTRWAARCSKCETMAWA
ncbi:PAS domain-containing protein [Hymenobacter sp. H14-R3]|uniref:PAS domain-containing sensor histidine kinase n=1 Tax=Hymenobacter sp. H14-R3 TaxID=3046308 RepID=UPI0024B8C4B9|nr:PAS domain-containing protein [Hymenobacter sp. H14-R3]MDJ0366353.1 PAS domain-containing protein [Hymenobacter sp. H14-R3]